MPKDKKKVRFKSGDNFGDRIIDNTESNDISIKPTDIKLYDQGKSMEESPLVPGVLSEIIGKHKIYKPKKKPWQPSFRHKKAEEKTDGGRRIYKKFSRKHKGIIQTGRNMGKLHKGYKYNGKKTKTGLSIIVKV